MHVILMALNPNQYLVEPYIFLGKHGFFRRNEDDVDDDDDEDYTFQASLSRFQLVSTSIFSRF